MAQQIGKMMVRGAINIIAGDTKTTANIFTDYPTANVVKLVSKDRISTKIQINGGVGVSYDHGFEQYVESATSQTWRFLEDCQIVIGVYK